MKTKYILLCCLLAAACVKTFSNSRSYAYWMEEPKWTEERTEAREGLKTAWIYLTSMRNTHWYFTPDSIISDSIVEDPRIVNEGQMHRVEFIKNGQQNHDYYYQDKQGSTIPVLQGVSANNEQPYSLDEYHYIDNDGLIRFNTINYIEMVLWCLNVLVSPWLWLLVFIFFGYKGIRFLKK